VDEACGKNKDNIILKLNGEVAEFIDGKLTENKEIIPVEQTLISGNQGEDVGDLVLKDREMLGENGIVIVSCTVDKNTKEILGGPEILTRGFIYVKESQDLLEETKEICREVIENDIEANKLDYTKVKNDIRTRLGNFFYNETESKPMIITVVQEV
jgi:ribonuclease J